METAPLTLAHAHVTKAAAEAWSPNSSAAGSEHELAAQEFANAARTTTDPEALRILHLLEDQHRRLAELCKAPTRRSSAVTTITEAPNEEDDVKTETGTEGEETPIAASEKAPGSPAAGADAGADAGAPHLASPTRPSSTSPAKAPPRRKTPRESTSSIANSLATARGIKSPHSRGTPLSSATSALASLPGRAERQGRLDAQLSPSTARDAIQRQTQRLNELSKHAPATTATRPGQGPSQQSLQPADDGRSRLSPTKSDEPFNRFFSRFENLFSAISAPLAFASLPLDPGPPATDTTPATTPPPPREKDRQTSPPHPADLDLNALISRPAMRALRDEAGPHGPFAAQAESFYVVPTTGGTLSYAGMLSNPPTGPADRLLDDDNEHAPVNPANSASAEEFVDAYENPFPPSPTSPRSLRSNTHDPTTTTTKRSSNSRSTATTTAAAVPTRPRKTPEELELENATLRQLLDQQSRRLQMWEAASQSQSMALRQSFRAVGARPPQSQPPQDLPPPSTPEDADAGDVHARVRALEQALRERDAAAAAAARDRDRLERQNRRLAEVVARYRDKWEELKEGARKRRDRRRGEPRRDAERDAEKDGDGGREGEVVEEEQEERVSVAAAGEREDRLGRESEKEKEKEKEGGV